MIDNVANTNYKTSNGPTPSKKPRKQNLAALTSPTKDTLIFSNGNNSNSAQSSSNNLYGNNNNSFGNSIKSDSSPTATQPNVFANPTNLPIYVKRELVYPPEKRELKTTLPMPNSTSISGVYPVPPTNSTVSQAKIMSPTTSMSNGQNTQDHYYIPKQLISPTYSSAAESPSQSTSVDIPSRSSDDSTTKNFYSRL